MPDSVPAAAVAVASPASPAGTVVLVRAMTAAAGLPLSEEEVTELAGRYQRMRDAADRLQALVTDTDPMPVFDPVPVFGSTSAAGAGRS
jgi:hypothetical protein